MTSKFKLSLIKDVTVTDESSFSKSVLLYKREWREPGLARYVIYTDGELTKEFKTRREASRYLLIQVIEAV